jgi:hypothetical protein
MDNHKLGSHIAVSLFVKFLIVFWDYEKALLVQSALFNRVQATSPQQSYSQQRKQIAFLPQVMPSVPLIMFKAEQ